MTEKATKQFRDPLEAARAQLDFGAIARDAPSARDVLFKAQTIVPLAPPRPWWRAGAAAAAVVALAVLALAPWIPQSAALTAVTMFRFSCKMVLLIRCKRQHCTLIGSESSSR